MKTVQDLISLALSEVGYLEKATNADLDSKTGNAGYSNYTKYQRDMDNISGFYNGKKQGYSWCDVFVDWLFVKTFGAAEAMRLLCQPDKSMGAGCEYSAKYYQAKGQWSTSPAAGYQVFFRSKTYAYAHTGLVVDVDDSYIYTVEGNTSTAVGVVSNGGGVCKKRYNRNYANIVGYGKPRYTAEQKTVTAQETAAKTVSVAVRTLKTGSVGMDVLALQAVLNARGFNCGTPDGDFGTRTETAVKNYQAHYKLTADGIVGAATWKSLLGV